MTTDQSCLDDRVSSLEPPYESPGEARIGRLLDRYGIPFFYKQPTLIYVNGRHEIWRPSFTLPHYGGLVIEYAAPSGGDVPSAITDRQQIYCENHVPSIFLLLADREYIDRQARLDAESYEMPAQGSGALSYGATRRT